MRAKLTDRQMSILKFIQDFVEENSYPPTYRQIGKKFNITSTFGVKRHIDALVKKGYLNIESKASRAISVNKNGLSKKSKHNTSFEIPIVGKVAAGFPVLAEENIEGTFLADPSLIKNNGKLFGLKVRGDSMIDAGIFEDDLVIINSQSEIRSGDIVVALIGEESTLKTFRQEKDKTYLYPANDKYPRLDMTNRQEFSIIGKVVGIYRTYN